MPLSDHEQKVLKEIEGALYQEDPKFFMYVSRARGGFFTSLSRKRTVAYLVLGCGAVMLFGGVFAPSITGVPVVSILGFLVVVGAGFLLMNAPKSTKNASRSAKSSDLAQRMENRFRRRFP